MTESSNMEQAPAVVLYGTETCPYCLAARMLLTKKGVEFVDISVTTDAEKRHEMTERSNGGRTVPQIFINDQPIGGFDDLNALDSSGELDELLGKSE